MFKVYGFKDNIRERIHIRDTHTLAGACSVACDLLPHWYKIIVISEEKDMIVAALSEQDIL